MARRKSMKAKKLKPKRLATGKHSKKRADPFDNIRKKTEMNVQAANGKRRKPPPLPPVVLSSTNSWFYRTMIDIEMCSMSRCIFNEQLAYLENSLTPPKTSSGASFNLIPRLMRKKRFSHLVNRNKSYGMFYSTPTESKRLASVSSTYSFSTIGIYSSTPLTAAEKTIYREIKGAHDDEMHHLASSPSVSIIAPELTSKKKLVDTFVELTDTKMVIENHRSKSIFKIVERFSIDGGPDVPNVIYLDSDEADMSYDANNNNNEFVFKKNGTSANFTKADDEQSHEEMVDSNAISLPLNAKSSNAIVMKGGKWRRSVCDIRNKFAQRQGKSGGMTINHRKSISILIMNIIANEKRITGNESLIELSEKLTSNNDQLNQHTADSASYSGSVLKMNEPIYSEIASTVIDPFSNNLTSIEDNQRAHLLRKCGQNNTLSFAELYPRDALNKCCKIGEGVFGEIFQYQIGRSKCVLKIVPIEGTMAINGAQQKRFDEILQEVIISKELSALRHDNVNQTTGFVELLNVRLVEGRYTAYFLDLWKAYDECQGTENESPECFGPNQLYVVFELTNSGVDLEKFKFKNADQSYSVFKQVAISLAIAESKFEFEHRDLHWGNILIAPTTKKFLKFSLNGKTISIPSNGVKATIIDYTLSRILYKNCCLYQNLSADPEIFEAIGDYQYDIYRLMKLHTNGKWELFEPFTNLLWMHYLINKIIDGVWYKWQRTQKHDKIIDEMKKVCIEILTYKSAIDFVEKN